MHALIIEDEFFIALALEDALVGMGYATFIHATGAKEAIQAAGERAPDLIVSDQNLLEGCGVDAVLSICGDNPTPVVFVTAYSPEVLAQIPSANVVNKPFLTTSLRAAVANAREKPFCAA